MSEMTLQVIAGLKVFWALGFGMLYAYGGMIHKAIRRYAGPAWIAGGVALFSLWTGSFKWWFFIYPILLMGFLHMGYGANDTLKKITRRLLYGFLIGFACYPLIVGNWNWGFALVHIVTCCVFSVIFGVFNITGNARNEETILGFTYAFLPMFMI